MSGVAGGDPMRAMAEKNTILRVPAGSTLHGLHLPGKDDRDEVGICVETIEAFAGFAPFEQYIYRTAEEDRAFVYATRLGDVPLQDVLTKAGELEREIKDLSLTGPLMAEPAREEIENWMITRYWHWWAAQRTTTGYFEADVRTLA